ncbi:hypothetical protein M409DRAFT_61492 [Zasmidium cellare ATCC 36951]|uniref:F-box domain-containing protein n=1 Tax=Zasmidium cellare ATCC 36951 TaxID=1080233 RepID=A0A6A6BX32_ZASCE|nr:uncharacterized protein M409DRAFT_61492 [Zasmidium cellare ATCC 36951]KAF2158598.1 hypothetical protein M409DRAFT_61492 [Zasmidium cellare ATCC 36951]
MPRLLDLPPDITTQIFGYFERKVDIHSSGPAQRQWDGLVTLQACRLTCRGLNELVSGMLCPVFRGSLDKTSMERIKGLSRNPLIAEGMRAVEINLAFRPVSIATSLATYCKSVTEKVDEFRRSCHYDTEFQEYEDEDLSDAAVNHRALLAAEDRLFLIRESFWQCVEPGACRTADVSCQLLLRDCFARYALRQQDEEEIVNDGSFVNTIATAMARFKHSAYLTFVDEADIYPRSDAVTVAYDNDLLARHMLQPHDWLSAETKIEQATLLPARLLVEFPIACARLGVPLQGLDIGCFPLKTLFTSLIPSDSTRDRPTIWSELSGACRELKTFQIGRRGMHCTPYREQRISPENCDIINGYLGTTCSSPELESVYISMCPFRVCGSRKDSPDLLYQAGSFLRLLNSSSLTRIEILNVEVSGSDLESMISTLPRYRMRHIRLCDITVNEGGFADTVEILRSIKEDSKSCDIDLSTLYGGEFGPSRGFDGSSSLFDDEDGDAFCDRLEEHMHPPLLRLTTALHGALDRIRVPKDVEEIPKIIESQPTSLGTVTLRYNQETEGLAKLVAIAKAETLVG